MIRLRVLGPIDLRCPDDEELRTLLAQPKRLMLLAYLAAATPAGFHRRDTLLALFWPELDAPHARDALSAALGFLRRSLGRDALATRGGHDVAVDPRTIWCDAIAFREEADAGRVERAASLYRGDLLEGVHAAAGPELEAWVARERARLRTRAVAVMRSIAERRLRDGELVAAEAAMRRAVELSDGDERVVCELLDLLDRIGDRAAAIRAFREFADRLDAECHARPSPETLHLMRRIRTRVVTNEYAVIRPAAEPTRCASGNS